MLSNQEGDHEIVLSLTGVRCTVYFPAILPGDHEEVMSVIPSGSIRYWTPPGHNSWVGDVVAFYYLGRCEERQVRSHVIA